MNNIVPRALFAATLLLAVAGGGIADAAAPAVGSQFPFGRLDIATVPFDANLAILSATYTPSGKVLVTYTPKGTEDPRNITLATMDDDGRNLRILFSGKVPPREKDNGLRYMVFADNKRILLGDFILECRSSLETCSNPRLRAVDYPAEVAGGPLVSFRWSEPAVAPDNRHVAWTTLLANYSAVAFVGELQAQGDRYKIVKPRIISTLNPFHPDPAHADGVIPEPVRGGEVKQFVMGGGGISMAGAVGGDLPDSVVQTLASGRVEAVTNVPGYTETTILSPDERLGVTMTTRFSDRTDPAILGLLPRPYPAALNMGLGMFAYSYAVTGVRGARAGSVGPALIDVRASKAGGGYLGVNLGRDPDWIFHSPMSWHPDGKRAMWIEGDRTDQTLRIRVVRLPDHRPARTVPTMTTPDERAFGTSEMGEVARYAKTGRDIDVKVYGRTSGYITYRRTPARIEKIYTDFSDDGRAVYSGREALNANQAGRSTYVADITLTGARPGTMRLKMTFGPLGGAHPAAILFDKDPAGVPLTHGYAEHDGRRMEATQLLP